MSGYDGLYHGAAAVERYRHRAILSAARQTPARVVIAKREIATPTHIPGDLSAAEIDQRFYAAMAVIRRRLLQEQTP